MKPLADTTDQPDLAPRSWTTRRDEKARRLAAVAGWLEDGVLPAARMTDDLVTAAAAALQTASAELAGRFA